jgi:hypothetical protein
MMKSLAEVEPLMMLFSLMSSRFMR